MLASTTAGVAGLIISTNYAAAGRAKVIVQLERMGANLIIVAPQQSRSVAGRARTGSIVTTLRDGDYRALRREVPSIARSSAIVLASFVVKAGDLSKPSCAIVGCQAPYAEMKNWPLASGRFIQTSDVRRLARNAVLGSTVARDLFPGISPIGQRILINRVPFEIIGVFSERGQGLDAANEDDEVYVPSSTAMARLMNRDYFDALLLQFNSTDDLDSATVAIDSILRGRHRAQIGFPADYKVQSQQQTIETLNASSKRLSFLIQSVGVTALLVSAMGLFAISWISVKDRTVELGTRRALGASARDIFSQISLETFLTSFLGAITGVAFGWASARAASGRADLVFRFEPRQAETAFVGAILLSLIFGLLPARRAATFNPIHALKHE